MELEKNIRRITCNDTGIGKCDFEITGETLEELKIRLFEHLADSHPEALLNLNEKDRQFLEEKVEEIFRES